MRYWPSCSWRPRNRSVCRLTLTLDRALEIALNDNPMIRVADLEIQRQDYVRKETARNLLPSLSASGS